MTRLFHGGVPGLRPGDLLLPPDETGHVTSERRLAGLGMDPRTGPNALEPDRAREDRVYLTPHRDLATAYAAIWTHLPEDVCPGLGALYTAEPDSPETDPDLPDGVQCPAAVVLAVYDPCVTLPVRKMQAILLRYAGVNTLRGVGRIGPVARWR